jgi:tRNA C32,U32 (ribose-2'-O)-methylase TrmJ
MRADHLRLVHDDEPSAATLAAWKADDDLDPLPHVPTLGDRLVELAVIGGTVALYGTLALRLFA